MADTTTGVTISDLTPATSLNMTDRFEVDRNGGAYSITYETMVNELRESLGIHKLMDALIEIIG